MTTASENPTDKMRHAAQPVPELVGIRVTRRARIDHRSASLRHARGSASGAHAGLRRVRLCRRRVRPRRRDT